MIDEDDCNILDCIILNDDSDCSFGSLMSEINLSTQEGVVYYIEISGYGGATGDFILNVDCDETEAGCMDPTACNYDIAATLDDGSCFYPTNECIGCDGNCILDFDGDGLCICEDCDDNNPDVSFYDECGVCGGDGSSCTTDDEGCMDPLACDYDPSATIQATQAGSGSGSLSFTWLSLGSWASEISWEANGTTYGAGDEPALTLPVGTYTITGYDSYGDGWNGGELLITDDLSGNYIILVVVGTDSSVTIDVTDGGGAADL